MARRFGGRHSPGGDPGAGDAPGRRAQEAAARDDRRVDAAGARSNILFVPPVLLVLFSLGSGPYALLGALAGAGALLLAAVLLREGLRAEAAYESRRIARRPAIPRKLFATALTGIGVGIAAWTGETGVGGSVAYGIAAAALHVAAFGPDPMRDKRMEGVDSFQQDRVARVLEEAEAYLAEMRARVEALGDRPLALRVAAFQAAARQMIRTVEEDPRDLSEARRYLGVYLMGARDATARFAELYARRPDPEVRRDYEALLTDLEQNYASKADRLAIGDRSEMDVEIKVLRDRLQREGVKPD